MARLVVFDLDGTLVDSRRSIGLAMDQAFSALGLEPPGYERTRRIVGLELVAAIQALAPDLPQDRWPALARAYQEAFHANRAAGIEEPLYEGASELVERLKDEGLRLGVATGKARRGLAHFLERPIGRWFDAGFCAEDGPGKPDPHMLRLNIEAVGARAEATAMVGDTSYDMSMARALDVHALGVAWGFHTAEEVAAGGAHMVAHDFAALGAALAAWARG